ncbi:MAG TPA: glucose-6-phosphate dehydrogenase [Hanamia sp.]|nr:glucose-6-phosphate dehydrogenase [Hanamia sp.]
MNEKKPKLPALITIFGAKGDLTRRKLIPALYNLYTANHLPTTFAIYCIDFLASDETEFKDELLAGINQFSRNGTAVAKQWKEFSANIFYIRGDFQKPETFSILKEQADNFDKQNQKKGTRLFYFATAPRFIEIISEGLYKNKICNLVTLHRIVVEKPFGTDLASAKKLNLFLSKRFAETQVYRIDHYLGKEVVQNIMAFRFANYVFEPLWNNKYIDHIQISVAEEVGVGTRGGYYDSSGALRDMIQNHLMQLLCIVAMECPAAYKAELIRDAKVNVLKFVRCYSAKDVFKNVVRGQYTAGTVNDKPQEGYRQEDKVSPQSSTETFVAAKFFIDNKRWKGVPFFLATGKSLPRQASVITIQFKDSPNRIFKDDIESNRLVISIQPELEIGLLFESKVPGLEMNLKSVNMDFSYQQAYKQGIPEAYEALLLDVLEGDPTLFMRADQVDNAWKVVMPILNAWKKHPLKQLHFYKAGTWGPKEALRLIKPYTDKLFQLPLSEQGK